MNLNTVDLNLLVVFKHLLVERSVSRVAEVMNLSQPAVSNALARLRKLLGDPLFLRTPAGMVPTPFAEQLSEAVTDALGMIHNALNQRDTFEPATSQRAFVIGMTDIGEIYFLPPLMDRLKRDAPSVTVSTVRNTSMNLKDAMEAGTVDLAIGLLPQLTAGFYQRRLFQQPYVCLMRQGHKLAKKKMSLPEFSAAEHLLVISEGTGHGKVDEILKRSGVERRVTLTVPHFVAVGHILQTTDMLATVPDRLAERMIQPFALVSVPHPANIPDVAINVFWHGKFHSSPANQWLRGVVYALFSE